MKSFVLITFTVISSFTFAGGKDSVEVANIETVIEQLFIAIQKADSSLARSVMHPDARLMTTSQGKNGPQIHTDEISGFIKTVGSPHEEIYDERISNLVIQVDGNLGQAWMDYSFFIDEKFSHCGVNAIQFYNDGTTWRIIHIMDTRRRDNCGEE